MRLTTLEVRSGPEAIMPCFPVFGKANRRSRHIYIFSNLQRKSRRQPEYSGAGGLVSSGIRGLVRAEPLSVFRRQDKRLDHLGIDEVAAETIEFV